MVGRRQLLAILGTLLVVGFAATSLLGYYVAYRSISNQVSETTLPLTSDTIYSDIQQDLLRPIFISSLMAHDTFLRDWTLDGERDLEPILKYLMEIQVKYGTNTSFFVSEKTRNYYHPSGLIKKISPTDPQDAWYFHFLNKNEEYEINVDLDTADQTSMTAFINYRVYDFSGQVIGVTGVGLDVQAVRHLIQKYQDKYGRHILFVDRGGRIMMSSAPKERGRLIRDIPGYEKIATRLVAGTGGAYEYEGATHSYLVNSRLIEEFDWFLIIEQQQDLLTADIWDNMLRNLVIGLIFSGLVLAGVYVVLGRYQSRIEALALYDKLTGAANRHMFDMLFDQQLKAAQRHGDPVSILLLDLDHFKKINDGYGHGTGDRVLKNLVLTLKERLRDSDTIVRWGGEEFLILLPDCDLYRAVYVAESLRQTVEAGSFVLERRDLKVTASIGVAQYEEGDSVEDLIARADKGLYKAKDQGRNQVIQQTQTS